MLSIWWEAREVLWSKDCESSEKLLDDIVSRIIQKLINNSREKENEKS